MDVPLEPQPGRELSHVNVSAKRASGVAFWQGHETGNQLVQLEAGITQAEALTKLRKSRKSAPAPDPAEESRMLARVLTLLLGLPLQPGSSFGDVVAALEPLCPQLLWSKTVPVETKGAPAGSHHRTLMALRDGLMIEVCLRQDRLYAVRMTDLELMILNEDLTDVGKARRAGVLQENLTRLASDPVPFALKWGYVIEPESVEWNRGMDLPSAAPQPMVDAEEYGIDLPEGLAGPDVVDLELRDAATGTDSADPRHRHAGLDRRHGSFRDLLENAADADLLRECTSRSDGPEAGENAYPRLPGLARAAAVLSSFNDAILNGGGLEAWFVASLGEVPDALAALRMTGSVEMEQFLFAFATRASEEGCDIESEASWQEFFALDARTADEEEALRLAPAIVPLFRAWALASPEVTAAAELSPAGRLTSLVSTTKNAFRNGLEGLLQKAARGAFGKTAQGLIKRATRPKSAPAKNAERPE